MEWKNEKRIKVQCKNKGKEWEYSQICVSILVQSKFKAIRAFEFGFDKDTELS